MVTSGEAYILCARSLDLRHPFLCAESRGVEASSQLGVFLIVEVVVGHSPFAGGKHSVQTPVKEYSELRVLEVFACCDVVGRGGVGLISVADAVSDSASIAAANSFFISCCWVMGYNCFAKLTFLFVLVKNYTKKVGLPHGSPTK